MLRRVSILSLALCLACGGATSSTTESTTPASATPTPTTPVGVSDNLPLADVGVFTARGAVELRADGTFRENGQLVGTFTADGGLLNVDGVEIGRLTPAGQIYFGGQLDAATIDPAGTRLATPSATIAVFDASGNLVVNGHTIEVRGYAPETGRTILFVFAMYSALISVAQRMDQEQQPSPSTGL